MNDRDVLLVRCRVRMITSARMLTHGGSVST
jgi:hypothetical protein